MTLDIGPVYPEDPRNVEHFDFCGNEIYRAYNLLSRYDMRNLLEEIDNELEVCEDKWDLSVEATNRLSQRKLWYKKSWTNFFKYS